MLQEKKYLLEEEEDKAVKCLVMVPTRELAIQITAVFEKLSKQTGVSTLCLHGGVGQAEQIEKIASGVDILIATPGRMFDLIYQKQLKITRVKILVLDEADHMLDLGFIKDIHDVKKFLPKIHQTLFFSATINPTIKDIAYTLVINPIRIQISPKDPVSKNITHAVAFVAMDDKRFFLERIIQENNTAKILVFVRTKVRAERVKAAMERVSISSETLHGSKEQADRIAVMEMFKEGKVNVMIATDVSARGIDIAQVDYVINYDMPDVPENYVHRVGRTGRGIHKGKAISFCSEEEKPLLAAIEAAMGVSVNVFTIDKTDYHQTIDFSKDTANADWKTLIHEAEKQTAQFKKPKKKKKK